MMDSVEFIERGGWKTHPKFGNYVSTLNNLDDKDKIKQNNKRTHFIRYVRELLVISLNGQPASFSSLYIPLNQLIRVLRE